MHSSSCSIYGMYGKELVSIYGMWGKVAQLLFTYFSCLAASANYFRASTSIAKVEWIAFIVAAMFNKIFDAKLTIVTM